MPADVALGDVNGDGMLDVVVAGGFASKASVLLNTGVPGANSDTMAPPPATISSARRSCWRG